MRRFEDRYQVLTRAWQVARPRRVGRVRASVVAVALLAGTGAAYTVQRGDTLSHLASQFGVSVSDLASANGINDPNRIYIGQVLTIPGQSGAQGRTSNDSAPSGAVSGGSSPDATTHIVQRGESLAAIARRYGLTVADLVSANRMSNANSLQAGTLLRVADAPPPPPGVMSSGSSSAPGTYTIQRGDTLSSIALRHGTTITTLVRENNLTDPNRIFAGQRLSVPGASSAGGERAWKCPVPGGSYINDFGVRKPDGRYHEGVDVFAPRGTIIVAPVGGTIQHIQGVRAGLQFTLQGDDGYTYIGTHLDAYGTSGRVEQGDPIGTVGTTGNARGTPPHLHFEMHHGSIVNPFQTLRANC